MPQQSVDIPRPQWQFDAASTHNDLGWSQIPLIGKRPALSSWIEFTTRRPTLKELRDWFSAKDCNFNIGIVCGSISAGGLIVVDADTPEDANWWLAEHPASPLMVFTGRGGMHVYYRSDGQQIGNRSRLFSRSIDLRGEHGYVVAPPSIHAETHKAYIWSTVRPFDDYSFDAIPVFDSKWIAVEPKHNERQFADMSLPTSPRNRRTERRIDGLIRHLDHDVADRSVRDFGVVMGLLRLGLPPAEIEKLVEGHSKFRENPKYLRRTINAALDAMHE